MSSGNAEARERFRNCLLGAGVVPIAHARLGFPGMQAGRYPGTFQGSCSPFPNSGECGDGEAPRECLEFPPSPSPHTHSTGSMLPQACFPLVLLEEIWEIPGFIPNPRILMGRKHHIHGSALHSHPSFPGLSHFPWQEGMQPPLPLLFHPQIPPAALQGLGQAGEGFAGILRPLPRISRHALFGCCCWPERGMPWIRDKLRSQAGLRLQEQQQHPLAPGIFQFPPPRTGRIPGKPQESRFAPQADTWNLGKGKREIRERSPWLWLPEDLGF